MSGMIFDGWAPVIRSLVIGLLAYLVLILWLRFSGKRTLSQWNAFDAIVTFALGSMLATATLSRDTSLVQGALSLHCSSSSPGCRCTPRWCVGW